MRKLVVSGLVLVALMLISMRWQSASLRPVLSMELSPIIEDEYLNIRAIEIDNNQIYYGSKDHLGTFKMANTVLEGKVFTKPEVRAHKKYMLTEGGKALHFRAIATTSTEFFGLSIGNPAKLYKISKEDKIPQMVYKESHEAVFYDAMAFWNDKEGIAIGDPTDGCASIIITRDGGDSWLKVPCDALPAANTGEAAFAASDTNIAIKGTKTWVATGGLSSRVLYSKDKGLNWSVVEVPIIQGESTKGLYSIDFFNDKVGFGIGGDYTKPDDNLSNKIKTTDGGKTWEVIANSADPGYRSCVQFIPNSNAQELLAVGFKGIDYSADGGTTWTHLSDEGFYTVRFKNDSVAIVAGSGRISRLLLKR